MLIKITMLKYYNIYKITSKKLDTFQLNLINELSYIDDKLYSLRQIINGDNPVKMTIPEAILLENQYTNMVSYGYSLLQTCKYYNLVKHENYDID